MRLEANGGVSVTNTAKAFMLTKSPQDEPLGGTRFTQSDPFRDIAFYSYRSGFAVTIVGGPVVLQIPAGYAGTFASLDGGIPTQDFVEFSPGQSGYIVFMYAQSLTPEPLLEDREIVSSIDFNDPSTNYAARQDVGVFTTNEESNTINGQRYGYVFKLEPPEPSPYFFQHIICRIDVGPTGIPTVYPQHLGEIMVPLGYVGTTQDFTIQPND